MKKQGYALVTGASKGIGYEIVKYLLAKNYKVIAVSRNTQTLDNLNKNFTNIILEKWNYDLSDLNQVKNMIENCKNFDIQLVINNEGYGVWGSFLKTSLEKELNMIDLNIKSLHYITKHFAKNFYKNNLGRIINVASVAAFQPGPMFSSYFASKAYVLNLGIAINTEFKKLKSKVRVVTICPGPIKTDFWLRSDYKNINKSHGMRVEKYVNKTLKKALKTNSKDFLLTGIVNKFNKLLVKIIPQKIILSHIYRMQKDK
ncbi:short-chain dehydrogenase [Spiroplasma gladiatoris]|uniref:Short-chain dehydrogenase n=1 Tax=Spiroplasma gladiatoris TaxID=2143 RepID=A0A4V1AQA0_9MOLU|nr:SDR family NAD(P)-dependent oxidoreductase [Spiroplasma gladiatoris]QBQ07769.1 short-chain dehydrogenase [Spiroplasma gladiatoris]